MSDLTIDNVTINTNAVTHNDNGNSALTITPGEAADIAARICDSVSKVHEVQAVIASKPTV